jgi:hypothetical protein
MGFEKSGIAQGYVLASGSLTSDLSTSSALCERKPNVVRSIYQSIHPGLADIIRLLHAERCLLMHQRTPFYNVC